MNWTYSSGNNTRVVFAVAMVAALAAACTDKKTDSAVVTTTAEGGVAASVSGDSAAKRGKSLVRLVNAISDKRSVAVTGDERNVFENAGYKAVTTYAGVTDNMVNFKLRTVGTDSVQAENQEMLTDGYRYTIVAMADENGHPKMRIFRDEVVPDQGKARVRVINAVPGLNDVAVAMQGSKDALFGDVDFGAEAGYKDIDPTTGSVEVRTDPKGNRPIVIKNMKFEAGKAYTIVLTGKRGGLIEAVTFDDAVTAQ